MNQAQPSWIGRVIGGRYKIEGLLGHGGMSSVYKAIDPNLQRPVAIKLIHPHLSQQPEFVRRFELEAAAVARLRHPNIVQVHDFNHDRGVYYIVLEYVPGENLEKRLRALNNANLRLPLHETIALLSTLCEAVAYAHQQRIVHRDLKPSNVVINLLGQPILMDFGVAKLMGHQFTALGTTIGTANYMSPEQVRGEAVDHRADIYSLGVMLYEMLAGKPPFEGESPSMIMSQHLNEPVPEFRLVNSNIPEALVAVLEKALAKDANQRFQSALTMANALRMIEQDMLTSLTGSQRISAVYATQAIYPKSSSMPPAYPKSSSTPPTHPKPSSTPSAHPKPSSKVSKKRRKSTFNRWLLVALGICSFLLVGLLILLAREFLPGNVEERAAAEQEQVGVLRFSDNVNDNETVRAGNCRLELEGVSLPPAGSHYELWLANDETLLNLGPLSVENGRLEFEASTNQNLIGSYDRALISIEADDDSDPNISNEILFAGTLPTSARHLVRQVVVFDSINGKGFLPGAEEQTLLAVQHAGFLQESLAGDDLESAQRHAEHVVNILDGESGQNFGDLNQDGQPQNPGDGFGTLGYLAGGREQILLASELETLADVPLDTEQSTLFIENSQGLLEDATKQALKVLAADSVAEAEPLATELDLLLDGLLNGVDEDGNGVIDPITGEGAILAAYQNALRLGDVSILTVQEETTMAPLPSQVATHAPLVSAPTATEGSAHTQN